MTITSEEAAQELGIDAMLTPNPRKREYYEMGAGALRRVGDYGRGLDWINALYNLMIEGQQGYTKKNEEWHYCEGAIGGLCWAWTLLTDGVVPAPEELIERREILHRRFGRVS